MLHVRGDSYPLQRFLRNLVILLNVENFPKHAVRILQIVQNPVASANVTHYDAPQLQSLLAFTGRSQLRDVDCTFE